MSSVSSVVDQSERGIEQIHEVFEYFMEENIQTDVSFSVKCADGCVEFSAHKLILSVWSPVLADMCHTHREGPIPIEDVSPRIFETMLKFMYGSFSNTQLKDIPFLLKLYKATVAYEVDALKNLCQEGFLWSTPNKNTVFQFLEAGKLFDCEFLVQRCYKILQNQTAEVLAAQELCNVTPAMLMTILDLPCVSFTSEFEVISWVLAWVKNAWIQDPGNKSFVEILGDFLPYLNFQKLTAKEFAKLVKNYEIYFVTEQDGFSIFMNIAIPGSYPLPSWIPSNPKPRKYRNGISDVLKSTNSSPLSSAIPSISLSRENKRRIKKTKKELRRKQKELLTPLDDWMP